MVPGDIIIGFSSTGQALWEDEPNSGIGSNGLTNARHDALDHVYAAFTETYAPLGAQRLQWFQETRIANKDAPLNPIPQPFA